MIDTQNIDGPVMLLHSGKYFEILKPDPDLLDIEDIAHALSNLCRYTGHIDRFYSVAEHSWLCSYLVPEHDRLAALLHDAAEMITGDIASPMKYVFSDYKRIEEPINRALAQRYKIDYPWSDNVKHADLRMLAAERVEGLPLVGQWKCLIGVDAAPFRLSYWTPELAKIRFLERFYLLTTGYKGNVFCMGPRLTVPTPDGPLTC